MTQWTGDRRARILGAAGALLVMLYAGAISLRPLNANDLFWHLATGREILRTGSVPSSDPFSFASEKGAWVDHEWLWQAAAESVYDGANTRVPGNGTGGGGEPKDPGVTALVLFGVLVAASAFAVAAWALYGEGVPATGIVVLGLLAVETARERLMVRPETMSLFFLALFLVVLGAHASGVRGGSPGVWRRGIGLAVITALWSNVHPAALLAPFLVLLHEAGSRWGPDARRIAAASHGGEALDATPEEPRSAALPLGRWAAAALVTAMLAGAGTLANPYGWRIWSVPFKLATLVKTRAFFNPEWLRPPIGVFPVFYLAIGLLALAALASVLRTRRAPEGRILVALAVGGLALQQMRHMGLFAIAFLLAGGAILRALDIGGAVSSVMARPLVAGGALACGLAAAVVGHAPGVHALHHGGLDQGRFPVDACERIAREGPGMRLFNDVAFGGYLIWRFYPPRQVFIDGRNELYEPLLRRLGRIQTGEAPYTEWKQLVADYGIDGAIVKDKGEAGMVTFLLPPAAPGGAPQRVRRAFSAVYFPIADWALVYFDDTAMVFAKRSGAGEGWIERGEYRALNPEDEAFVLDKASRDPVFAARALEEAERRANETPRCEKAEHLLAKLRGAASYPRGEPSR